MPEKFHLFGNPLKTEPVRLYSIATALVALAAYFLPSGAWPLVLGLAAAVLGVGQQVRSRVTPYEAD